MSESDEPTGDEPSDLNLDFQGGRFKFAGRSDDNEWVSTATRIAEHKARTENYVALILVIALVASLPIYLIILICSPGNSQILTSAFTPWLTVVGSLAGAAVGVGAMAERRT
jgi:hypothetical protein